MAEPIQVNAGGEGRNRRVFVLVGVAAVVLLAVVVLPGFLFGGDDGSNDDDLFGAPTAGVTTTTTAPSDEPVETFEVFSSKNPFRPLVAVGTPAQAPAGESTPGGEEPEDIDVTEPAFPLFPDDAGPVTFPEDSSGSVGDPGSPPTTAAPPPPPRQPDRVGLLEVFTDPGGQVVASVRVNDITHQVAEGDVFSTSYRVIDLDISTRCGQFLFGDDRFGLCEGDEVLK